MEPRIVDRTLAYTGAIPQTSDILQPQRNTLYGLGYLAQAILGTGSAGAIYAIDGLACTPTSPATLHVNVGVGSCYEVATADETAYSDLGVDANTLVKQGVLATAATLTLTAPTTSGYSQNYLVQVAYSDVDGGTTVLSYYNSANPAVPYAGPGNAGTSNYTTRQGQCVVALKAGVPATTGTQATPAPDAGYIGLYSITVANGQTQITSPNITSLSTAPFIGLKLPAVPAAIQAQAANYGQDTGTANAIAIALPVYTSVTAGLTLRVRKGALRNTGPMTLAINGGTTFPVKWADGTPLATGDWPGNSINEICFDGATFQLLGSPGPTIFGRTLAASLTYYVNAGMGSDSNDGLTSGSPFATLQKAANVAISCNLAGFSITIHVANGVYGAVSVPAINGSGSITFVGDAATPSNCVISNASGSAIKAYNCGNSWSFNGFQLQSSGYSGGDAGCGLTAGGNNTNIFLNNIIFGTCQGAHMSVVSGASLTLGGDLTISGGLTANPLLGGSHMYVGGSAFVTTTGWSTGTGRPPLAITTSVSIPTFVVSASNSLVEVLYASITGAGNVTGMRYNCATNAIIDSAGNGTSYFPGTIAGVTGTGGQYV